MKILQNEIKNSIFIGHNAGKFIKKANKIIILGDDILDLNKKQKDVLFITDKILIGKKMLGRRNELYYAIKKIINK